MKKKIALKTKAQISDAVEGPEGELAAVDWKGNLYLLPADGEEAAVHQAHSQRAQGVAFAPGGGVITVGWDGLRSLSPRGDERARWEIPPKGPGRAWAVRVVGDRVAVDVQRGAKAELWLGTVSDDGAVQMEPEPRTSGSEGGQPAVRIAGTDTDSVYWRAKGKLVRVPFRGGKVTTAAKIPTRDAVWSPHGVAHVLREGPDRTLQLPGAGVPLLVPSDFYPLALARDRVAVGTMEGTLSVMSWEGTLLAAGKHTQCSGLAWMKNGHLMSWGWDKRVRIWSGMD